MKKLNYKLFLFGLSLLAFGCMDDDQDYPSHNKPTATVTTTDLDVTEGDDPVMVTITIDRAISLDSDFKIDLLSDHWDDVAIYGEGGSDIHLSEYENGPEGWYVTIPAYSTSVSFYVEPLYDIYPEGTESARIRVSQGYAGNSIVGAGAEFAVNISNITSNDFQVILRWDGEFTGADGDTHDWCGADFDLEFYDANFGLLAASWYDCPESITVPEGVLPDGDYWVIPGFYSMVYSGSELPEAATNAPASIIFAKPGVWVEEVDLSTVWNTATGGLEEGNDDAYLVKFVLTIEGNTYTVTDIETGETIVSGKSAAGISSANLPVKFKGSRS
ncbi:hypothetical protein GZ212_03555 [Mangrovimonas sp. CR14]|uniref:hypothetical protein n=1 Tax=Mangrovimonas sp. CR14 TaxID=2706120 RepID=UPI00141FE2EC|nr:hypothetical protein [Mangrovimonas sp. CR14]NIK91218.1 hypothetical protein [Mangrovimonas sp. CR14]